VLMTPSLTCHSILIAV